MICKLCLFVLGLYRVLAADSVLCFRAVTTYTPSSLHFSPWQLYHLASKCSASGEKPARALPDRDAVLDLLPSEWVSLQVRELLEEGDQLELVRCAGG